MVRWVITGFTGTSPPPPSETTMFYMYGIPTVCKYPYHQYGSANSNIKPKNEAGSELVWLIRPKLPGGRAGALIGKLLISFLDLVPNSITHILQS